MKLCLAIAILLTGASAHAAYGVKWKPGDTNAVAGAYLVADSAFEMRMRQPDGKIRVFHRDFEEPNKLYGDAPWVGEDLGNQMFSILTNPEFKGGRTGYVFQNGHLRRMILGRKDYSFDFMPFPKSEGKLEALWPKELTEAEAKDLFATWKGDSRWSLGYKSPNKAGFLCAEVVLVALGAAFFWRRRKCLAVLGALGACCAFYVLFRTESRGALVALVVGLLVMAVCRFRQRFGWKRLVAALGAIAVGVAILVSVGQAEARHESDSQRIRIWKSVPCMMVDSPCGWGLGNSGVAYTCWYQPPTEFKIVRTLVNSHLTWLVELGWLGRFAYLTVLVGVCLFLLILAWRGANPLPAALFCSFATAGMFNSVMEAYTLWLLPIASVVMFLRVRPKGEMVRFALISLGAGAAAAVCVLAAIAIVGVCTRQAPPLRASGSRVVVNGTIANTWVVDDGVVLGRGFIGKELRMFYAAFPDETPLGVVWNVKDIPPEARHVVLAGKKGREFLDAVGEDMKLPSRFKSVTFISPSFEMSEIPESLVSHPNMTVYLGELAARHAFEAREFPFVRVVPGALLYLPGWMRLAAAPEKSFSSTQLGKEEQK